MVAVCFGCFSILEYCLKKRQRVLVSVLVAVFSEILPIVVRVLVELERHQDVESYESSYLLKSVPSHWFTAVFAPWFISAFTEHNDTHVLYHIMDVLLLHALSKPLVRVLDPIGRIKRIRSPKSMTSTKVLHGSSASRTSTALATFIPGTTHIGLSPSSSPFRTMPQ